MLCREKRPNFVSAQIKAKCVVPDVLGYIWSALCKNIQLKVAHTRRHKVYISQSPAVVTYNTALAWCDRRSMVTSALTKMLPLDYAIKES